MADNRIEVEIVLDDGSVVRGLANVRRQADKTVGSTSRLGNAFSVLGKRIFALGAAFLTFQTLRESIRDFISFEKQLVAVGKTTNLSQRQLEDLGERFQQLSRRIPVTTNTLLEFAESAGQLGVRGSANLEKFADTLARLEVSTDIVGQEGARSLVRILNITRSGIGNIDRFGSAIVELGNNFAATEGEILNVSNEVARATAAFNLSAEEVLGVSTAIKALGGQAESAGTAVGKTLRTIASAIANNSKELTRFAKVIGVTTDELKKQFQDDAAEVFRLFINRLGQANLSSSQLTKQLSDLGLNNERVLKTLLPLIQNYQTLNRALDTSTTAFQQNTALTIESERAFATLGSELQKLRNVFKEISTDLGSLFAPKLSTASKAVREFLEDVRDIGQALKDEFGSKEGLTAIERIRSEIRELSKELRIRTSLLDAGASGQEGAIASLEQQILRREQLLSNLLRAEAQAANASLTEIEEKTTSTAEKLKVTADQIGITLREAFDFAPFAVKIKEGTELTEKQMEDLNKILKSELQQLQGSLKSVLVNGATQAFASFGRAVATGQDGLKALGQSVLNTLGALAIQLGQFFLLVGAGLTATQSILGLSGGAAIAAGAGLIALGGALQAVASGSGTSGAGGGGVGGGAVGPDASVADEIFEEEDIRERGAQINLTVQGNVLDRRETGLEIVEILQEAFDTQQANVVTV